MVVVAMWLIALGVASRSVYLHVFEGEFLRKEGSERFIRYKPIMANRGMISDRNGVPLAVSSPIIHLNTNPMQVMKAFQKAHDADEKLILRGKPDLAIKEQTLVEKWRYVAKVIGERYEPMMAELKRRADLGDGHHFLAKDLQPDVARKIFTLNLEGVFKNSQYKRFYPAGEVAAQIVGLTNHENHGQEGIELSYDDILQGTEGLREVVIDRKGSIVELLGIHENAKPGKDIQLSIDLRAQYLAYKELAAAVKYHRAESGTAVALDVKTGEILAMVNNPSYNPNDRSKIDFKSTRNRAMIDLFEPGSTVKPFTIATALASGHYTPHSKIDVSPGYMRVGRKLIRDLGNYGVIDITTILTKSSNVGASKLALSMQPEVLVDTFRKVGLGEPSSLGFPGEQTGHLPFHSTWRPIELATLSYGYGVSVTALQLAQAYAVLANDGVKLPLSLIKVDEVPEGEQVIDPKISREVVSMLETVLGDKGTAKKARVPGYRVAGKTGTVHKTSKAGGYLDDRYLALFAGIAPASDPQIVLVVVLDDPKGESYYGGAVAGPVFSSVMAGLLRIKNIVPDQATEPLLSYLENNYAGHETIGAER